MKRCEGTSLKKSILRLVSQSRSFHQTTPRSLICATNSSSRRSQGSKQGRELLFQIESIQGPSLLLCLTRLDHHIESWSSISGALTAWVRVPVLDGTADTELFVYYGNAGAADQQDPTGVYGPDADLVAPLG